MIKMLKVRRIPALILVGIMFAMALFGCGTAKQGAEPTTTAAAEPETKAEPAAEKTPEETVAPKEIVKLSFCLSQTGWGGEAVDPELMKEVELAIEAKTSTDLEVIAPPQSSYNDKLNVMLSSNDAPDIFAVRKAMDNIQVYAARGYTRPLDDLLPNFANITSQIDPSYMQYVTVNGKVQAIPMYVPMKKNLWLRKDMIDKFGINLSSTPSTEEFYTEMKKAAGSGVIPFTFPKFLDNLPFFTNPFGAYFGIAQDSSGKYYDGFNTPEMKEALTYIARLYADGIWDQEFLTNENAMIREKLFTGKAVSTLDYWNRFLFYSSESVKVNAATEFVPVYELRGPTGKGGNLNEAINDVLAIAPNCANPDRALEVIDYYVYTEEGVKLRCLGVQDKHFTIENGEIKATEKAANSGYKCDVNQFYLYYPKVDKFDFSWGEVEKLIPRQLEINSEVVKYLGPKYVVIGGKSDLYDKNQPAYKKKIEEIASLIIMGATTVDKGYVDFEAFWKSISGDEMLNELNK